MSELAVEYASKTPDVPRETIYSKMLDAFEGIAQRAADPDDTAIGMDRLKRETMFMLNYVGGDEKIIRRDLEIRMGLDEAVAVSFSAAYRDNDAATWTERAMSAFSEQHGLGYRAEPVAKPKSRWGWALAAGLVLGLTAGATAMRANDVKAHESYVEYRNDLEQERSDRQDRYWHNLLEERNNYRDDGREVRRQYFACTHERDRYLEERNQIADQCATERRQLRRRITDLVQPEAVVLHACNDGIDNDGDGRIDSQDIGCENGYDDSE